MRASQHPEGKIIEPVTGEVFEWDELKKVRAHSQRVSPRSEIDRPDHDPDPFVQVFIS